MKKFNVYEHPDKGRAIVKVGFSWPAFFFGIIWMICKGLWKYVGIMFVLYLFMLFLDNAVSSYDTDQGINDAYEILRFFAHLIINLVIAVKGNAWNEARLRDKGYDLKKTITAPNYLQAQKTC